LESTHFYIMSRPNVGALLSEAAEDAYDDDDFDAEEPAAPRPRESAGPTTKKDGKKADVDSTLAILRSGSDEIAQDERRMSVDAFSKAAKQVKLDVSIRVGGDVEGILSRASDVVNDGDELAKAGVHSRRGDEDYDTRRRTNNDDDDDNDKDNEDEEDDDEDEDADPELDRELFVNVYRGNARIVDKLLSNGARPHALDLHGWSSLHWAASEGHDDILELLIDHAKRKSSAAKLKRLLNRKDKKLAGWAPLHVAAVKGAKMCAKVLVDAGAKISTKNKFGETPLECLASDNADTRRAMARLLSPSHR
jgi:hypothetical protein